MKARGIWHPWRHLAHHHPHITVRYADLPDGMYGYTDFAAGEVVLERSLLQVERRCTVTHEDVHLHRGPVPTDPHLRRREEAIVDGIAARRLVSLGELIDALLLSDHPREVADQLWVDVPTLRTRVAGLAAAERDAIEERLRASDTWGIA